ncbi:hypothetical protein [Streptomyces sp. MN13]
MQGLQQLWATSGITRVWRVPGEAGVRARVLRRRTPPPIGALEDSPGGSGVPGGPPRDGPRRLATLLPWVTHSHSSSRLLTACSA